MPNSGVEFHIKTESDNYFVTTMENIKKLFVKLLVLVAMIHQYLGDNDIYISALSVAVV